MVSISDASQCPKIIAPIVKTAVLIQISTAALFSEMVGVGFMIQITATRSNGSERS
jgi:hypothetical protein